MHLFLVTIGKSDVSARHLQSLVAQHLLYVERCGSIAKIAQGKQMAQVVGADPHPYGLAIFMQPVTPSLDRQLLSREGAKKRSLCRSTTKYHRQAA
jgi:hypothetical protein